MKELRHLNKYFFKYKFRLGLGIIFIIISNTFQIIPAPLIRLAIDYVTEIIPYYQSFDGLEAQHTIYNDILFNILLFAGSILLMTLSRGVFLFMVRQTIIVMSRLIEFDLKNEIYAHYQSLPLSFYRRNNTGDLMNRISEDVSKVRMYLGPSIMYGLNLLILLTLLIPHMLSINIQLTLYVLIPLPILSLGIYYVNNIINKRSEAIQTSQSILSTFVQEAFSGIRVLKAFVREGDSTRKFKDASNVYKSKSLRLTIVQSLFFPLIMFLIGLSTILTVYAGGIQVIKGSLTYGNIAEFIIYVNLLTWPVTSLGWISSIIQRAAASQKRINEFLKVKNDIVSTESIQTDIQGKITFKNVSFTYPESGIKALKNVSFEINSGESLAIIGTTGSGKSTIATLISRMYDTTTGNILIDNRNITSYDVSTLRSQIGYVPQDVFLFSGTILNNITFGIDELGQESVIQAAKDADLYENIKNFPNEFNTIIGERGVTLSGGQKQRVSIARAIVRNPKILMLDDSLSAVDTKTENTILHNLKKIMVGRTSVIISHRVSSAKLADKIIVLDEGTVIEEGTNKSLLARNSTYKALHDKQLNAEEA